MDITTKSWEKQEILITFTQKTKKIREKEKKIHLSHKSKLANQQKYENWGGWRREKEDPEKGFENIEEHDEVAMI